MKMKMKMKEKGKLSLFVKLMSGFMSIALLLLLFSLYSVNQLRTVGGYFDKAYTKAVVPMGQWAQFKLCVSGIKSLLNCHIAEPDMEKHQKIESELVKNFDSASEILKKLGTDAIAKDEIAKIGHSVTDFSKESQATIKAAIMFHWNQIADISKQVTEYSPSLPLDAS